MQAYPLDLRNLEFSQVKQSFWLRQVRQSVIALEQNEHFLFNKSYMFSYVLALLLQLFKQAKKSLCKKELLIESHC